MTKFLLILFSAILITVHGWAQIQTKYMEYGDKLAENGKYTAALKNYDMAMSYDSNDAELRYKYGLVLRSMNYYKKALYYFQSVQKLDKRRSYPLAFHYAGEMYKYLGDYSESLKEHKRFVKIYKGDKSKYEYLKSLYEIEHNSLLFHLKNDTVSLSINNGHPVNTAYPEYAAVFHSDSLLVFSSLRSDSLKKRLVLDSNRYYSRIYTSRFNGVWEMGQLNPVFHENEEVHIANATYSPKNDYIYYTECPDRNCVIFRARISNGEWMDFEALPEKINLKGFTNTQPILARINGLDYLFFVSDRQGGYGKLDIWYTIAYSNGLFEDAVNLGDSVNSPGNEICPFYLEEESALYFSSDWYTGLGGFDIFRCFLNGETYSSPENPGFPLNSSYNDLYFRHKGEKAVLTSNREGSVTDKFENCCNDLYFFDYKPKSIKTERELTNVEKIEKLLPLKLYFHNDEPNPRSQDTTTSILYSATYIQYIDKLPVYEKEYAMGLKNEEREDALAEIDIFFENEVKMGYSDLKIALSLVLKELESGESLELTVRGFASPLSKSDYNRWLTLRRINAVENEINHFSQGRLAEYIKNGRLKITRQPFGEDRLSAGVSDDINDRRNAVYSKKASYERRVEIISVKVGF